MKAILYREVALALAAATLATRLYLRCRCAPFSHSVGLILRRFAIDTISVSADIVTPARCRKR